MECQWFWWISWISRISWNLLVRSRWACPSGVDQDSFPPRKRSFQRVLKMFESIFYVFSTMPSWYSVVEIARCRHNQQNVENCWKSRISRILRNLLVLKKIKFLLFSTLSSRFGVVETNRFLEISKIRQNPWFSTIFNILLIVTTSGDLDDTKPTR